MLPGPKGEAESLIANSSSGTRAGQSSARSPAKERKTSAIYTADALYHTGGVVMVWRAEDERRTQRRVQARSECAGEARVAVRDEHVSQPHVAEHRRKLRAAVSAVAVLKVGTSHTRPARRSM